MRQIIVTVILLNIVVIKSHEKKMYTVCDS